MSKKLEIVSADDIELDLDDDEPKESTDQIRERYSSIPKRKVTFWCQILPNRFQACRDPQSVKRIHSAIFWAMNEKGKIYDVIVLDGEHGSVAYGTISLLHSDRMLHRGGCCEPDWRKGDDAIPEAIFAQMLEDGFEDVWQLGNALEQFEQIEGCAWATLMLKGLG